MTPETKFKQVVKKWMDEKKIYHVAYAASRFGKSGIPDTLACVNGFFIAIEFKRQKGFYGASSDGEPTELQKHHIGEINKSRGLAMALYPSGYEEFKKIVVAVMDWNTSAIRELELLKRVPNNLNGVIWMK